MTKLFNFKEEHFQGLIGQKIPLDCIFILEMLYDERDVDDEAYLPYIQRLQRKGYIDGKGNLTEYGRKLYESMSLETVDRKPRKIVVANDDFERWWTLYPSTNDFEMNGKHFQGTQKKNIKKEQCRILFTALCNEFSPQDIIEGTSYHINMAKEISYKKKENQLTYIPNSERYLREKYFENYIQKAKKASQTKTAGEFEI